MKKIAIIFSAIALFGFTSCNKCHECHADVNGAEVELGEYCGCLLYTSDAADEV